MDPIALGHPLPELTLPATGGEPVDLASLRGRPVVLYFYPKDNTPGCTQEGQDFRDQYSRFQQHDCLILGVSRDSLKSHENFKARQGFPFELLSDQDEQLCNRFDVIKPKTMFGKPVRGIERSTFLFDREGLLRREWRKVKVKDHVEEVLQAVEALSA